MSGSSLARSRKTLTIILVLLVLLGGGGFFAYKQYQDSLLSPNTGDEEIAFEVPKGSTVISVIEKLYDAGLIRNKTTARLWAKLNRKNTVYAGNFLLRSSMSVPQLLDCLSNEKNAIIEEVKVTIIDGDWAKDAAKAIGEATNLSAEDIMKKWNDIGYVGELIKQYEFLSDDILASEHCYLEGFLYPDTYYFYKNTTVEQVTEKILSRSQEIYDRYRDKVAASGRSYFEIITLASVINFEANTEEDMRMVSGVFANRFAKGMKMGSSVTVCYALYDDFHSWQDCERNPDIDSKYNTYLHKGLPVGPICNPCDKAINAAVDPIENDYYYFMSSIKTGKMYYARDYEGHLDNIKKYMYN